MEIAPLNPTRCIIAFSTLLMMCYIVVVVPIFHASQFIISESEQKMLQTASYTYHLLVHECMGAHELTILFVRQEELFDALCKPKDVPSGVPKQDAFFVGENY